MYMKLKITMLIVCLFVQNISAQQLVLSQLPEVPSVIAVDWLSAVKMLNGPARGDGKMAVVVVQGQSFDKAVRVTTIKRPASDWRVQLAVPTNVPVKHGQVMLATFHARAVVPQADSGEAQVNVSFRQAVSPRQTSVRFAASVGSDWQVFHLPFRVNLSKVSRTQEAGKMQVSMNLGFSPQIIEIANLKVQNFSGVIKLEDLSCTQITYEGRELDARWRKEAHSRIRKHRMADLAVTVVDEFDKPVSGAKVHVQMQQHAFGFGSVVNTARLWELTSEPNNSRYKNTFLKLFNMASFEGAMKPKYWGTPRYRSLADRSVAWLTQNHVAIRGHTLVWPEWFRYDDSVKQQYVGKPDELQQYILGHIKTLVGTYAGKVACYDVVNELYLGDEMQTLVGDQALKQWLVATRESDPQAKLYINENRLLSVGAKDTLRLKYYDHLFAQLKQQNAPIDGVGMQGHFGSDLTPPVRMLEVLDHLAKHNLKIQVTEFTVGVMDQQLQADYTRDALTLLFSHPSVNAVTFWGFWEGQMYYKQAALFTKDWKIKPNGKAYQDLVLKQWWTDEQLSTNDKGAIQTRGFQGEYLISVTHQGMLSKQSISLGDKGASIVIHLEENKK